MKITKKHIREAILKRQALDEGAGAVKTFFDGVWKVGRYVAPKLFGVVKPAAKYVRKHPISTTANVLTAKYIYDNETQKYHKLDSEGGYIPATDLDKDAQSAADLLGIGDSVYGNMQNLSDDEKMKLISQAQTKQQKALKWQQGVQTAKDAAPYVAGAAGTYMLAKSLMDKKKKKKKREDNE